MRRKEEGVGVWRKRRVLLNYDGGREEIDRLREGERNVGVCRGSERKKEGK